jgi:hypothetical protein
MKIKKEKWNTLDGVLDKIWLMLEHGASDLDVEPQKYKILKIIHKQAGYFIIPPRKFR